MNHGPLFYNTTYGPASTAPDNYTRAQRQAVDGFWIVVRNHRHAHARLKDLLEIQDNLCAEGLRHYNYAEEGYNPILSNQLILLLNRLNDWS